MQAAEIDPTNPDLVILTICGVKLTTWRCADEAAGLRCGKAGTLTESTHTSDRTKWWCAQHFPPFVAWSKAKAYASAPTAEAKAAASGQSRGSTATAASVAGLQGRTLGSWVASGAPKPLDPEAEAERTALQAEGADLFPPEDEPLGAPIDRAGEPWPADPDDPGPDAPTGTLQTD